jgi:putative oxidoreductase
LDGVEKRAGRIIRGSLLAMVAGLFLFAGANKALDPGAFARAIERYRLLPWPLCAALALYLPWLEIVAAFCLGFERSRRSALWWILLLTGLFTGVLISAAMRGLNLDCGCLGSHSPGIGVALARNAGLMGAVAVLLMWRDAGRR